MLNMASSGENVQDSTSENGDLHVSREDTVSLVKTIISSEFRDLKKHLLNTNKPVNYLKRKYPEEGNINFKYTGNQKQYNFNCSILFKLEELKKLLEISVVEDIEASIDEIVKDINSRNKLIKIADRTEGGWTTVEEYQQIDYADDSDDDRKIRQANARALQKKRRLQRRTPASATTDINHRGHLFRGPPPPPRGTEPRAPRTHASAAVLGDTSDVTVEHRSPTVCRQKSLLSRATHSHFPGVRQRYLPHKREVPENSGTEVKYNFTYFADNKTDLQFSSICEDGCDLARNVKGSFKKEMWNFGNLLALMTVSLIL